jgi:hypothetical protein
MAHRKTKKEMDGDVKILEAGTGGSRNSKCNVDDDESFTFDRIN